MLRYLKKIPKKTKEFVKVMSSDPASLKYSLKLLQSYLPWHNSLVDKQPWLVFKAVSWLQKNLNAKMNVFEYGSGGSTIFIAKRVKKVISIEYDANWYQNVKVAVKKEKLSNCQIILCKPEIVKVKNSSDQLFSNDFYSNASYEKYSKVIENYPDKCFDLIIIDGRVRLECLKNSLRKVKNNGFILFDNVERQKYQQAFSILKNYRRFDFKGACPYSGRIYQTSVWSIT